MKKWIFIFILMLLLGFVLGAVGVSDYTPRHNLSVYINNNSSSDTVSVKIANRNFEIPRVYVDLYNENKIIEDSVVLVYVLPEFDPPPPHPQEREKRKKLILEGRLKGMLLEDSAMRPSLNKMVSNSMGGRVTFNREDGIFFGLEKYTAPNDMAYVGHKIDELFVERDEESNVISFLRCSPPQKDKVPGCRHTFIDKGILYRIRWTLADLPNWEVQKNNAINFIDALEKGK